MIRGMITDMHENCHNNIKSFTYGNKGIVPVILTVSLVISMLTGCGKTGQESVEDEVTRALLENGVTVESLDDVETPDKDRTASGQTGSVTGGDADEGEQPGDSEADEMQETYAGSGIKSSSSADNKKYDKKLTNAPKYVNPYLGTKSTATSYKIDFEIQTDSGVAGITWGASKEHAGEARINTDKTDASEKDEFYIAAFDCTREIPRFYFARYKDGYLYEESYTNLDFMFPEMVMFTGVQQIVEIKVSGMGGEVFLDSYKVCDLELAAPEAMGLIGTWISNGDYHAYIDNVFVAEGYEGDGDWIYSDDFSGRTNLFSPNFRTVRGRLYAEDGYYTTVKSE